MEQIPAIIVAFDEQKYFPPLLLKGYIRMEAYLVIGSRVMLGTALCTHKTQHSYHNLITWSFCYYLQSKY